VRYVLPAYALLFVLGSALAPALLRMPSWARLAARTAPAMLAVLLLAHPPTRCSPPPAMVRGLEAAEQGAPTDWLRRYRPADTFDGSMYLYLFPDGGLFP